MAKKTLIAKHKIAIPGGDVDPKTKKKRVKYAEPGTKFQIESDEADRLVAMGAAVTPKEAEAEEKKATAKADKASDLV